MSRDASDTPSTPSASYFGEVQQLSFNARAEYMQSRLSGGVDEDAFRSLAEGFYRYWDFLRQYKTKDGVDWPDWIDELGALATETEVIEKPTDGPLSGSEKQERPKLFSVDPEKLVEAQRELDDVAAHLGFIPEGSNTRPRYHAPNGGDGDEHPEPWGNADPPV